MVMFIFGDRDIPSTYFPNDRVLYDLGKKQLRLGPEVSEDDTSGFSFALKEANVDFSRTIKEDVPCNIYFLEIETPPKTFVIENCDSIATLQKIEPLK